MKKCPKCGTVLDDSKKKCYMCGADLLKNSSVNFGDSFNAQIGATMSGGQNNAFNSDNNVNNINNVNFNNVSSNIGSSNGSSNLFQNQLNGLNSLQYDDRSKFEKMLDNDKKKGKKSNDRKQDVINNTAASNVNSQNNVSVPGFSSVDEFIKAQNQSSTRNTNLKEKTNLNKADINWGNNLSGSNKDVFKFRDKVDKKKESKFSLNVLFNFICFLICVGGIAFVYFKFVKGDTQNGEVSFGGLKYTIDEKFVLKTDDSHSRYYTYGDNCAVRLNYGVTNNPDGFIESYFEKVKDTYSNRDDYNTSIQKITINDNEWSEVNVQGLKENAAAPGGYSFYSKYKHIAIVYKGNYFDIVYANTEDDSTCSAMYDTLVKSFSFE